MKKKKMPFETRFWAAYEINDPFEVFEAFFDYDHLDDFKQRLGELMMYSRRHEIYDQKYPGRVFIMYAALRSFVRACHVLQLKSGKRIVTEGVAPESLLHQASLSIDEYKNPFLAFTNAFAAQTLSDYEFFLCEIAHLSLSPYTEPCDTDLMTPYIHLVKMLDAAQLVREQP